MSGNSTLDFNNSSPTPAKANDSSKANGCNNNNTNSSSNSTGSSNGGNGSHKSNGSRTIQHSLSYERKLQQHVEQTQLALYRQNTKLTTRVVRNDLESKINQFYSKLLVNYHWLFLLVGVVISSIFTGVSFVKQPLPNILDPKRGFSARGEGTLTSQLIVMKNVNTEITKYNKHILEMYENAKKNNIQDFDMSAFDNNYNNDNNNNGTNSPSDLVDDYVVDDEDTSAAKQNNNSSREEEDDYSETANERRRRRKRRAVAPETTTATTTTTTSVSSSEQGYTRFTYAELMARVIWNKYTGRELVHMMPTNLSISKELDDAHKYHALNNMGNCNYSLSLDQNLEFYFAASHVDIDDYTTHTKSALDAADPAAANADASGGGENSSDSSSDAQKEREKAAAEKNLLTLANLQSLCKWDKAIIGMLTDVKHQPPANGKNPQAHLARDEVCHFSLPYVIALLNNKTDCAQLDEADIAHFVTVVRQCRPLHASGFLYVAAEEDKQKPEIMNLLNVNNPIAGFVRLPVVRNNICFKKNLVHILFEHVVDKQFMEEKDEVDENDEGLMLNVKLAALLIMNGQRFNRSAEAAAAAHAHTSTTLKPNKTTTPATVKVDTRYFNEENVYRFYLKHFWKATYDDQVTKVIGINLMGIRQEAAMRFINEEMLLVALAITLIVIVTLLYLKSLFISMIVNLGVAMSVGIAFFAYRIVFDIDLFPFINMMTAFLLIGIACDDVYVLFDSWYSEKAKVIMQDLPDMIDKQYAHLDAAATVAATGPGNVLDELDDDDQFLPPIFVKLRFANPQALAAKAAAAAAATAETQSFLAAVESSKKSANEDTTLSSSSKPPTANGKLLIAATSLNNELAEKGIDMADYELNQAYVRLAPLSDEQMVRVMGGTLRHAVSSIFVTSFTTAAAFLTNFITKLPSLQLFGVFTGVCILLYFLIVITMVAAFVISYEKYIQPFRCKVSTRLTKKLEQRFAAAMDALAVLNYRLISQGLPHLIIKCRLVFFAVFLLLGCVGMLAVFYKPQLKPPANWRFQFFQTGNLFENFEFHVKDQFWSYLNEEKRNLTNPEIFFVFGIIDKDNGRLFNPDDDGHLIYDKRFDFLDPSAQIWLNKFINVSIASRTDLFLASEIVEEWTRYLYQMQQFCYETMGIDMTLVSQQIYLPYERHQLAKCRDEIQSMLVNSSVHNFENLLSSFPRRIVFMSDGRDVNAILLRVNANRTFFDFDTVRDYYLDLKDFHAEALADAPAGFSSGWFISVAFALYDLQYQLMTGTYSSLVASMTIALIILLFTSGNIIISVFAIITISFSIANTIAIFVLLGWTLGILESIIIIMSVGLSVDFSCHYGVAYINSDRDFDGGKEAAAAASLLASGDDSATATHNINQMNNIEHCDLIERTSDILIKEMNNNNKINHQTTPAQQQLMSSPSHKKKRRQAKEASCVRRFVQIYRHNNNERFLRIHDTFERVGSAVLMAAFTTFLAGFSMYPSSLISFCRMGQFLMLVMCFSYLYATFFFVPMCALFGPTHNFGKIRIKHWCMCTYAYFYSLRNSKKN